MDRIGWLGAGMLGLASFAAQAGEAEVRRAVMAMKPQAKIESIQPAASPGYFEVLTQGQLVYVSADGKHLMAGDLWQVDDRVNLTARRKDGLRHNAISGPMVAAHRTQWHRGSPYRAGRDDLGAATSPVGAAAAFCRSGDAAAVRPRMTVASRIRPAGGRAGRPGGPSPP